MEGNLSPAVVKSKRSLLVNLATFFPLELFEGVLGREVRGAGAPHMFMYENRLTLLEEAM
jgi:hypothetical protein